MDSELSHAAARRRATAEERTLLQRFRDGDPGAFAALVRPQLGSLLALGRRLTGDAHWAEDLTQETLVRAYRGLASFRGEGPLRGWLLRILIRLASEPERWRRRERAHPLDGADVPDHLGPSPEQPALARELHERLDEAMERLPARQRAALHLRAVEGLDYAAVAAALDCSAGAARMLVLAARRAVLTRLGSHLGP
jgi:RNA polymerase sigma-70 factor (ECF subfamily)